MKHMMYCKHTLPLVASILLIASTDAAAAKRFATGGEVTSFRYTDASGIGYTAFLHTFTNTAAAAEFRNTSGKTLPVRLLAVGGGGAGGDGIKNTSTTTSPRYGGGGGGGGGVTETNALLSVGDVWTIRVGAGGRIPVHGYNKARGVAGASSVSNGVVELVLTPGGGAGGSFSVYATEGAAGGGGSGRVKDNHNSGTNGTYRSFTFKVSDGLPAGPFKGGDSDNSDLFGSAGGGGGAGEEGHVANGGEGLVSDITGVDVTYGSGGGGGGMIRVYPGTKGQGAASGGSGGDGAGNAGECDLRIENEGAKTNLYFTSATVPASNRGGGGAGGATFNNKGDDFYVGGELVERDATTVHYATEGADGVVIIRYDIPDTPCVGGDIVTVTTNGQKVVYVHTFTNTSEAATFKPSVAFDGTSVRLLAVGGGGAGADGYCGVGTIIAGGGGGGGGGVTETNALLSVGDVWTIRVGAGGGIPTHGHNKARGVAGASSVSNSVVELVLTPGGGAGGNRGSINAKAGAAGGGGSGDTSAQRTGASGTYASSICGEVPVGAPFSGGTAIKNSRGGGGGGAGGAGAAASAGVGLVSNITGVDETYGAGGGGGGVFRVDTGNLADGYAGGENAGVGGKGVLVPINDGTATNLVITAAKPPVANTGAGGAGGVSFGGSANHESLDATDVYATAGADGVVIIRYEVDIPRPKGFMIIVL